MLVSFSAENFLSFKEPINFTTKATRERQHNHRVFTHRGTDLKLVPIAAVFGGNASGKSNFYRAIHFLRRLVLRQPQTSDEQIGAEPFKLDDGLGESRPSRFVIEILPSDTVFRLTVAVCSEGVVEEKLEEVRSERSHLLYSRLRISNRSETVWEVEPLQRRAKLTSDQDFIAFKTRDTLPNQVYLGALRGKNVPVVDEVATWFNEQLALMLPDSTFKRLEFNLPTTRGLLEFCNETLRTADTGVHDISPQRVSWQDFPAPSDLKEEIKKNLGERQITFVIAPDGRRFSVTRHHGDLYVARIYTHHRSANGTLVRFELSNESEGTQRFIDLLPAFYEMVRPGRPKVFVIDELDRSLHTQLSKHLVQSYLRAMDSDSRSQLIFTTHDVTLLDQELLRRDEIWFIEKDPWGVSSMVSLASFEGIRYDRDIRRGYLEGNYGGVPRFTGPAFRALPRPRNERPKPKLLRGPASHPTHQVEDYAIFADAFPATDADHLLCELALDLLDLRPGIWTQDHLDALILATHPVICRSLSSKKPTRKTDALFDSVRSQTDLIAESGLKWNECISYLEQSRKALEIRRGEIGQPIYCAKNFEVVRQAFAPQHVPLALFALSVLDSVKETRGRPKSADRSHAARTFEQLRAQYSVP